MLTNYRLVSSSPMWRRASVIAPWIIMVTWCYLSATRLAAEPITVFSRDDATANYAITVFEMAMNKAQAPYTLNVQKGHQSAITSRRMLEAGETDVIWATTSKELEEKFIAVRVPLYKGLMGYRTLLIKPDKQALFNNIQTLDDLKKVTLGQVHSWADTAVLEANGLKVIKATKHKSLFNRLKKGSFDAAPRAIHETILEASEHPELTSEKRLLLHYQLPMYFFVNPRKPELAHQLTYGLSKAIRDGSLDILLYRQESVKQAVAEIQNSTRIRIELDNPDLPPKTPIDNKQLWFSL